MAFFEDLGKKLTKVGEAAAEKTKEVAEFTKANAKILDIQNKLDKAYGEVGKKYLELHPANDEEDMKAVVDAVYALEDQLKELRRQLQDLKGTVQCDICGFECDAEAAFCSKCGAELKKTEVIIDVEVVEEADAEEIIEEAVEEVVEEVVVDAEDIEETVE